MTKRFEDDFQQVVTGIIDSAKSAGIPLTTLCDEVGISTATLYRYQRRTPKTVTIVDRLQRALEARQ